MTSMHEFENPSRTPPDDQLDAVLAKYAAGEPRTGLEERILAKLKSRERASVPVVWSRWAGALAAALLVAISLLWVEKHSPQQLLPRPTTLPEQASHQPIAQSPPPHSTVKPVKVRAAGKRSFTQPALAAAEPKLDRFPSPQPLTEEELALVRYVQSFPQEATLIAQAQEEFELETQKQMNEAGGQHQPYGSNQQER
jgi:hypothetical protein